MKVENAAKMKYGFWGLVGGAVIAMILGFMWGGWTTSSTANAATAKAVVSSHTRHLNRVERPDSCSCLDDSEVVAHAGAEAGRNRDLENSVEGHGSAHRKAVVLCPQRQSVELDVERSRAREGAVARDGEDSWRQPRGERALIRERAASLEGAGSIDHSSHRVRERAGQRLQSARAIDRDHAGVREAGRRAGLTQHEVPAAHEDRARVEVVGGGFVDAESTAGDGHAAFVLDERIEIARPTTSQLTRDRSGGFVLQNSGRDVQCDIRKLHQGIQRDGAMVVEAVRDGHGH